MEAALKNADKQSRMAKVAALKVLVKGALTE